VQDFVRVRQCPPLLSQHADDLLREAGPALRRMLEAKMKDQALLKLRDDPTKLKLW
jgi:hypothetical protein